MPWFLMVAEKATELPGEGIVGAVETDVTTKSGVPVGLASEILINSTSSDDSNEKVAELLAVFRTVVPRPGMKDEKFFAPEGKLIVTGTFGASTS